MNVQSPRLYTAVFVFIVINVIYGIVYSVGYIQTQRTDDQLFSYKEVAKVIAHDAKDTDILLTSLHPAHGYYQKSSWIFSPPGGVNDFCDVVEYNVSDKVFDFAPKSDFNLKKEELNLNYIIIVQRNKDSWDFVSEDLTLAEDAACYDRVSSIYRDEGVNVLKVKPQS